jgi:hypothetical protein
MSSYITKVIVNGQERQLRTMETDDRTIAMERHEKNVAWAESYSNRFGRSVTAELHMDGNVLYSVDFEY